MPGMTSRTASGSGAGGSRSSFGLGRHSATASHRTSTGSSRRGRGAVAGPGSPILGEIVRPPDAEPAGAAAAPAAAPDPAATHLSVAEFSALGASPRRGDRNYSARALEQELRRLPPAEGMRLLQGRPPPNCPAQAVLCWLACQLLILADIVRVPGTCFDVHGRDQCVSCDLGADVGYGECKLPWTAHLLGGRQSFTGFDDVSSEKFYSSCCELYPNCCTAPTDAEMAQITMHDEGGESNFSALLQKQRRRKKKSNGAAS